MRLLSVELTRLRWRRAYWLLALLGVLFVLVAVGAAVKDRQPPSAGELAAAQEMADRDAAQPWVEQEIDRCLAAQQAGDTSEFPADYNCEEIRPRADWYLSSTPALFADDVGDLVPASALTLALLAALIGATFIGADWSAGTVGTHLGYEPRRGRVFASKAGAVAVGVVVPAIVALGAVYVAMWVAASAWGTTDLSAASELTTAADLVWLGLRALAFVAGAGAGGYLLAMAFRSSLVAIGALVAYGFVVEGLLRALWDDAAQWVVSTQAAAWLFGGFELQKWPESCEFSAEPCQPITTEVTQLGAGVYLSLLVALGLLLSYAVFRRRDVT